MPLTCPRCDAPMTAVRAATQSGGAPVELDLCERCQGLWIDGPELAAVCPTVAHLPERRLEVALLGKQGAGIARCPRCGQVPYELVVLEIPIDFCAGCAGVWFDGDEYGELDVAPPGAADAPRGGPYRRAAVEVARTGEVACAACARKVPIGQTHMWEQGLLCRFCHALRSQPQSSPPEPRLRSNFGEGIFLDLLRRAVDLIESPATRALRKP